MTLVTVTNTDRHGPRGPRGVANLDDADALEAVREVAEDGRQSDGLETLEVGTRIRP